MACIVYREGAGTIEHGIECESTTCEAEELGSLLASGWMTSPPGYRAPEPVVLEEPEDDELHPVRAAGRDAGIEGWETMHLASLKKALKDQEA